MNKETIKLYIKENSCNYLLQLGGQNTQKRSGSRVIARHGCHNK